MKKSFTIIEIIVAIGIFGVGVLAIAGFFATSAQTVRVASHTSVASNLASGLVDEEFSKSYEELIPATGTRTKISSDPADPFYLFEKQINIKLIDSNLATSATDVGLKQIDCFIYWQEGDNEKNVQMSTVKSRR